MKCAFFPLIMAFGTSKSTLNGDTPPLSCRRKGARNMPAAGTLFQGGVLVLCQRGRHVRSISIGLVVCIWKHVMNWVVSVVFCGFDWRVASCLGGGGAQLIALALMPKGQEVNHRSGSSATQFSPANKHISRNKHISSTYVQKSPLRIETGEFKGAKKVKAKK